MPWTSIAHHAEHIDPPTLAALHEAGSYLNTLTVIPKMLPILPLCPRSHCPPPAVQQPPVQLSDQPAAMPSHDPRLCWVGAPPGSDAEQMTMIVHRRSADGQEVLMLAERGELRLPAAAVSATEKPSATVRRLMGQYFAKYDTLLYRALDSVTQHATALGRHAVCVAVKSDGALPGVRHENWLWAPLSALDALRMPPADRRAVMSAARPLRAEARASDSKPCPQAVPMAHVLAMPTSTARALGLSKQRPVIRSTVKPVSVVSIDAVSEQRMREAFIDLQSQPDGKVNFDTALLHRLIAMSRDRARSRGAVHVTPRDISAAAQLIAEDRRGAPPSPADELPAHYDMLMEKLRAVCEDAAHSQSGRGCRAPRVLVAGDGIDAVASMFAAAGADVATCDLGERQSTTGLQDIPHFRGQVSYVLDLGWDLVIAQPPGAYLSNASVQWLHTEPGRMARMREAAAAFERLRCADAPFICLQHPKMHKYARQEIGDVRPTQYVHPWQHGTGHTKPTGLFLEGLPELEPMCVVPGRLHAMSQLSSGPRRTAIRSRTYLGVAGAMAVQWMPVLQAYVNAHQEATTVTAADLIQQATRARQAEGLGAKPAKPPAPVLSDTIEEECTGTTGTVVAAVPPPRTIPVSYPMVCEGCSGSGVELCDEEPVRCSHCFGSGAWADEVAASQYDSRRSWSREERFQGYRDDCRHAKDGSDVGADHESTMLSETVDEKDTHPWMRPRQAPMVPMLPVTQLRKRYGRWYGLAPANITQERRYVWRRLDKAPSETVDTLASELGLGWRRLVPDHQGTIDASKEIDADRCDAVAIKSRGQPLAALKHRSMQAFEEQPRWRQAAVEAKAMIEAQTYQVRRAAEMEEQANAERAARAEVDPRFRARRIKKAGPGLKAAEEKLGPPLPEAIRPCDIRRQFQRFVTATASTTVPVCPVAPGTDRESTPDRESGGYFEEADIAEPPPPLTFDATCAYIKNFHVARRSGKRHGLSTLYSVAAATCRIDSPLSDTGAGPSCVGSALLAQLPADACVSRSKDPAAMQEDLVGPDGQPLVQLGKATLIFTMAGHPFRHEFLVIEGGNLLLLGNDFLGRYRATVTPFDGKQGHLKLQVRKSGVDRQVLIPLSCNPKQVQTVGAIGKIADTGDQPAALEPSVDDTAPTTVVEGLESSHPALIPIDGDTTAAASVDDTAPSFSPDELVHSQMQTSDYLLYNDKPLTVPARTETTTWIRAPHIHQKIGETVFIDRIPQRMGIEAPLPVACGLAVPDSEGYLPVRVINTQHKAVTIPASSPLAHLTVEFEVSVRGAIDPSSGDPYEKLSAEERALVDSVVVDPEGRLTAEQTRRVRTLLAHHIEAFAMNPKKPTHTHLMNVELPLKEGAMPHRHAASRLGPEGQAIVDKQIAEMEANGIIRKSNSAWGSRVVLVRKKSGETRFCIDFRDTNRKLQTLDTPIPRCDEAIDRLASGAGPQDSLFLCTLDLAAGFWTLPIREQDKGVTAFVTHRGKYEWNYLPFGVQSGPSWMCSLMDAALAGIAWESCMPYLDDIAVWSTGVGNTFDSREASSFEQMMQRLDLVLERLRWAGLSARADKCLLFATSASYLGHVVSRRGLEMDPKKIDKIRDIDPTSINTIERVRSFLGLCSYYRRFVKGFASITAPLSDLTRDGVDVAVASQTDAAQDAIKLLIKAMTTEPIVLRMPRFDRSFVVKTDGAQTEGIGGCLVQHDDEGHERVVAYYGRRLTQAERKYTVTEIELLGALECIRTWRPYLWGRQFKLVIDHAALKWLHTMKDTVEGGPASRLMRWILKLQEYSFEVEHKPGKSHADADAVSRLVASISKLVADSIEQGCTEQQDEDGKITARYSACEHGWVFLEGDPDEEITPICTKHACRKSAFAFQRRHEKRFGRDEYVDDCDRRSDRHTGSRYERLVANVRTVFTDWVAEPGVGLDEIEAARPQVVAALWPATHSAEVPIAASTARSLLNEARRNKTGGKDRRSIREHYVQVGTPNDNAMRAAQAADPECQVVRKYLATGSVGPLFGAEAIKQARWARQHVRHLRVKEDGLIYRVDPIQPSADRSRPAPDPHPRLYVPESHRAEYLCAFHDHFGHQGAKAMMRVMKTRAYWPSMEADIVQHVAECHECTFAKLHPRQYAKPTRPTVGSYPFDSVVCDIVKMKLTADKHFDQLIVFADSLSRWVEAVPCLGDPTAEQVLDAYATHVACRYGWPREIRADGGSNLIANKLAEAIHTASGVDLLRGAAYHPQSQGIAERVQATLAKMCATADEGGEHWVDHLPYLMFSYHATPHRATGLSPAMIMYGRELRLPAQLGQGSSTAPEVPDQPDEIADYAYRQHVKLLAAWECARDAGAAVQERAFADACAKHNVNVKFNVGDRVCYRLFRKHNKLVTPWFGPCRISEVLANGNYVLTDLPNAMVSSRFHVSQLRIYRTHVDAEELTEDEFIVDRLLDRRGQPHRRQYLVKWRGYPRSRATWEPRGELMRRCESTVEQYDRDHPPRPARRTEPTPTAPAPAPAAADMPPPPDAAVTVDDDAPPHRAVFDRGRWRYARHVNTSRGVKERLFDEKAFMPAELESPHFLSLRNAATALAQPAAAVIAALSLSQSNAPRTSSRAAKSKKVLILFSGSKNRTDGIDVFLRLHGFESVMYDVDPRHGGTPADDLTDVEVYTKLLDRVRSGEFHVVIAAPPCSTFSIARYFPCGPDDPPMVRDREHPMGLANLGRHTNEVYRANLLVRRTCDLLKAAYDAGSEYLCENPADRGSLAPDTGHLLIDVRHAPMWVMPCVQQLRATTHASLITFSQCQLGAEYQKYTSVLCSPALAYLFKRVYQWDTLRCTHRRHPKQAGGRRGEDGRYESPPSAAYPTEMNRQIADAVAALGGLDESDVIYDFSPM